MSATEQLVARLLDEREWLHQAAWHDQNDPRKSSRLQRLKARLRPRYGNGTAAQLYAAALVEMGTQPAVAELLPAVRAAWDAHQSLRDGATTAAQCTALARLVELLPAIPQSKALPREPLTDRQQQALEYIRANQPVTGKQIASAIGGDESTVTRHLIPALKSYGVKNRRGAGYYLPT